MGLVVARMLSILVLTPEAAPEDVAVMVEAHLVGPAPLAITKALDAQWTDAPG